MSIKLGITLLSVLVLSASGCDSKSGEPVSQSNAAPTASASNPANVNVAASPTPTANSGASTQGAGFVDACALIEKSEIASVQGAEVRSTVPSTQMNGSLAISQCYYTVSSADGSENLSVHLEVIQADPTKPNAVKEYWERAFEDKEGKGEKDEKEKESGPPLPVRGVGEEAFWTGSARVGALYALNKGKLVRVSVGGTGDQRTKIEKSKKLVSHVLKRLS